VRRFSTSSCSQRQIFSSVTRELSSKARFSQNS
jgi:hypothetical protein